MVYNDVRMRLTPRYDAPVVQIDVPLGDVAIPLLRQRARLGELLATLDDAQWAAPSRCDAWSVQDVVAHLVGTNQFWTFSITSAAAGTPTRFLADFDPVATPAQLVDAVRSATPAETLDGYNTSNVALAEAVAALDDDGWAALGEAPPGHLPVRTLTLHALWDAWVHERDIVLALGGDPVVARDEVVASLVYAAALGPA